MGKIMEAIFCIFYLIATSIVGILILKNSKGRRLFIIFGVMSLVLVSGDSFHLVPRILVAFNPKGDYHVSLGIGKLVTSITMTIFYLILYWFYEIKYEKKNWIIRIALLVLAISRIVLCLLPQNDWTGEAPVIWGIYRNIPFVIMGIIIVVLFFLERKDKQYRFMWLAITLSFAFYIPVVLWADKFTIIGMLMLPKTIMYMWAIWMGFVITRKDLEYIK